MGAAERTKFMMICSATRVPTARNQTRVDRAAVDVTPAATAKTARAPTAAPAGMRPPQVAPCAPSAVEASSRKGWAARSARAVRMARSPRTKARRNARLAHRHPRMASSQRWCPRTACGAIRACSTAGAASFATSLATRTTSRQKNAAHARRCGASIAPQTAKRGSHAAGVPLAPAASCTPKCCLAQTPRRVHWRAATAANALLGTQGFFARHVRRAFGA